jgi:hypothetical protein
MIALFPVPRLRPLALAISAALTLVVTPGPVLPQDTPPPMAREGLVLGIDLSSPQTAATAFVTLWQERDFLSLYFTLDPALQDRFVRAVTRFDMAAFVGRTDMFGRERDRERLVALLSGESDHAIDFSIDLNRPLYREMVGYFIHIMHAAHEAAMLPLPIADHTEPGAVEEDLRPDGHPGARVALDGPGGMTLVLRRSPSGWWRVIGIESDQIVLPVVWTTEPN